MADKTARAMAYEAGRAAMSEPAARRTPDACPFPTDQADERAEWLRGFGDVLDEQPDPAALRDELKAASA